MPRPTTDLIRQIASAKVMPSCPNLASRTRLGKLCLPRRVVGRVKGRLHTFYMLHDSQDSQVGTSTTAPMFMDVMLSSHAFLRREARDKRSDAPRKHYSWMNRCNDHLTQYSQVEKLHCTHPDLEICAFSDNGN